MTFSDKRDEKLTDLVLLLFFFLLRAASINAFYFFKTLNILLGEYSFQKLMTNSYPNIKI